jgi:U4/U6 small nuclear ribonucleoprotein PRP4
LRTGRSILVLQGHAKPIFAIDFAPNGYQIATGSEDNTIRIHDLRMLKCNYETIAAHNSVISHLKFYRPGEGIYDESALNFLDSFDDVDVKMEDEQDTSRDKDKNNITTKQLIQTSSHTILASCSYDGTAKLWSSGDWKLINTLKTDEGKTMCVDVATGKKTLFSLRQV